MIINKAVFKISSPSVDRCPDTNSHEFAFIGRSNVGKSSLINMLTGRKGLAMTSSTPGKTMLINHFFVNASWYLQNQQPDHITDLRPAKPVGIDKVNQFKVELQENIYASQATRM